MAKVKTILVPAIGEREPFGLAQAKSDEDTLCCLVTVIQTPSLGGFVWVAYEPNDLGQVGSDNIISSAFRLGDGCSITFKVEPGQKLWVVGTAQTWISYHVYKDTGSGAAGGGAC